MARLTGNEAVEQARTTLGLDASVTAVAWPVERLDEPGSSYYLVLFGRPDATRAVAAVDATNGDVISSARLPGRVPHLPVSEKEAAERAGLTEAVARLVWQPSRQSRSLLYPLWEVRQESRIAYVDQQGGTWPRLEPGGAGG
jgi:hypothetical protein